MANQIKAPINYPVIAGGKIVAGGSVLFGQPNVKPDEDNPSTLKAVYLDAALTQPAQNPQGLSSDGVFDQSDNGVLFGSSDTVYSIVIKGANNKELSYIPEYDLSDANAAAAAQDSAADAASSEANALSFKNLTEALYTDFTNRYFGAFSSDPSVDDLGNPPNEGSIYFNSTSNVFFTWTDGAWVNHFPSNPNGLLVTATGTTTPRALGDRAVDSINVRDFSDMVVNDDWTIALNYFFSLDLDRYWIPAGVYKHSGKLTFPVSGTIYGDPSPTVEPNFIRDYGIDQSKGTHLVSIGTGAKTDTVRFVTKNSLTGGVQAADGKTFELLDFTNQDATPSSKVATLKAFSVAVHIPRGRTCVVKDLIIYPEINGGVSDYSDTNNLDLSDDWDVGIFCDNNAYSLMERVIVYGHWRMAGVLGVNTNILPLGTATGNKERSIHRECMFSGYRGVSLRAGDVTELTGVTSNTLEVPFTSSNLITESGDFIRGKVDYSWTSTTVVGDKITLNGVTPDPIASGESVGNEMRFGGGLGWSGTAFYDCRIHGLEHQSDEIATSSSIVNNPFTAPSINIEMSGGPLRNINFFNTVTQGIEDCLAFYHDVADIYHYSSHYESKSAKDGGVAISSGSRIICTSKSSSNSTYQAGESTRCYWYGGRMFSVNLLPRYDASGSRQTTGLFTPISAFISDYQYSADSDTKITSTFSGNIDLIRQDGETAIQVNGSNGHLNFIGGSRILKDGDNVLQFFSSGNATFTGEPKSGGGLNFTQRLSSSAQNDSIFVSSGSGKLEFKDSSGNVSEIALSEDDITFTPVFGFVSPPTFTTQVGKYTAVAGMVFVDILLTWTGLDTADTSSIGIQGLPILKDSQSGFLANIDVLASTGLVNPESLYFDDNGSATQVALYDKATGAAVAYNSGRILAAGTLALTLSYRS